MRGGGAEGKGMISCKTEVDIKYFEYLIAKNVQSLTKCK